MECIKNAYVGCMQCIDQDANKHRKHSKVLLCMLNFAMKVYSQSYCVCFICFTAEGVV